MNENLCILYYNLLAFNNWVNPIWMKYVASLITNINYLDMTNSTFVDRTENKFYFIIILEV